MLFDCTALFIGLCASVAARWKPNQMFTYGCSASSLPLFLPTNSSKATRSHPLANPLPLPADWGLSPPAAASSLSAVLCSYGRVEVLSGFVNGIFLVFIAIFVLMESIERFIEPPDIDTDKLLLVSTLVR